MSGTFAIIDGNYYAYRYFFGMPSLTGPGKRPTGVSPAFAQLFKSLREDPEITHLALVFDHPDRNFRHELYPDYKANRDPMPDQLRAQMADVHALATVSRVPVISIPGYEADDVIASLARRAEREDPALDIRICSKDKDLSQVISERIHVWDPVKQEIKGPVELLDAHDIRPDQVIDYLCMIGDSADNVPGIKGVGPKTAVKLLAEFGTLENLLASTDQLKGKRRENVEAFAAAAALTRELITIREVADLPALAGLVKCETLDEGARAFYCELGFSMARYFPPQTHAASLDADYTTLDLAGLGPYLESLRRAGRCAIDTETTGLDPLHAQLVGISFAAGTPTPKSAAYLPLCGPAGEACVDLEQARPLLAPFLADPGVRKVMQNAKYDLRVFAAHDLAVDGLDGDPMLASWLLNPARESHGLDFLTRGHLAEDKIPTAAVIDLANGQTMAEVPIASVARYACEDAQCTWRLAATLEAELEQQGLLAVYREQELPLVACLADMEQRGISVDVSVLETKRTHLQDYLTQLERDIAAHAGNDFNPASPRQVAQVLFDRLGLPALRKTRSGPSTDVNVLRKLREFHELPGLILQYRALAKLLSSYLNRLPEFIDPTTGRIHANLRQTGTETGRLSCERPNLQNIPKRTDLGRELRAAFVPVPEHLFLAADYSQIELRVLAHLSGDPTLSAAFRAGDDIHRFVAAAVNHCDPEAVTPEQRNAAKAVNFGIIYGQSAFGLAQQLGITRGEAARFIDEYFERFSSVRAFVERVVARARERGYVETLAGRRRYVPDLHSGNRNEVLQAERTALNSTIQGSAADLIKRAMLRCRELLPAGAHLILQIHDELLVETPATLADDAGDALERAMTGAWNLDVPLVADVKCADNWLALS
ncbi:MAG: DNA polymerase I [Planctomycetota bacterium]